VITEEITGANESLCITVKDFKGNYFIKFSDMDRLSLDKGPFNGRPVIKLVWFSFSA